MDLAVEVGISQFTVFHIIKDIIRIQRIASLWVMHHLTEDQKWQVIVNLHLEGYHNKRDAFICCIITFDKTWVQAYKPELKQQMNEWHHAGCPCLKKIHQEPIRVKVTHTVACDIYGLIPHCVVPAGHTITVKYYQPFLMHHLEHF
jgi:hypothetical protein